MSTSMLASSPYMPFGMRHLARSQSPEPSPYHPHSPKEDGEYTNDEAIDTKVSKLAKHLQGFENVDKLDDLVKDLSPFECGLSRVPDEYSSMSSIIGYCDKTPEDKLAVREHQWKLSVTNRDSNKKRRKESNAPIAAPDWFHRLKSKPGIVLREQGNSFRPPGRRRSSVSPLNGLAGRRTQKGSMSADHKSMNNSRLRPSPALGSSVPCKSSVSHSNGRTLNPGKLKVKLPAQLDPEIPNGEIDEMLNKMTSNISLPTDPITPSLKKLPPKKFNHRRPKQTFPPNPNPNPRATSITQRPRGRVRKHNNMAGCFRSRYYKPMSKGPGEPQQIQPDYKSDGGGYETSEVDTDSGDSSSSTGTDENSSYRPYDPEETYNKYEKIRQDKIRQEKEKQMLQEQMLRDRKEQEERREQERKRKDDEERKRKEEEKLQREQEEERKREEAEAKKQKRRDQRRKRDRERKLVKEKEARLRKQKKEEEMKQRAEVEEAAKFRQILKEKQEAREREERERIKKEKEQKLAEERRQREEEERIKRDRKRGEERKVAQQKRKEIQANIYVTSAMFERKKRNLVSVVTSPAEDLALVDDSDDERQELLRSRQQIILQIQHEQMRVKLERVAAAEESVRRERQDEQLRQQMKKQKEMEEREMERRKLEAEERQRILMTEELCRKREAEGKAKREAEEKAMREAEEKAKREYEDKAREAQEKVRAAEEKAKREAEEKGQREAEENAIREAEEQAKREAEEQAKREAEEQVKREAEEKAKRKAEEIVKRKAEEMVKREAEEKAKREAEEKAKREAEEIVKREAEENAQREAEQKLKVERALREKEEKEKLKREQIVKREAEEKARQRIASSLQLDSHREKKHRSKRSGEKRARHSNGNKLRGKTVHFLWRGYHACCRPQCAFQLSMEQVIKKSRGMTSTQEVKKDNKKRKRTPKQTKRRDERRSPKRRRRSRSPSMSNSPNLAQTHSSRSSSPISGRNKRKPDSQVSKKSSSKKAKSVDPKRHEHKRHEPMTATELNKRWKDAKDLKRAADKLKINDPKRHDLYFKASLGFAGHAALSEEFGRPDAGLQCYKQAARFFQEIARHFHGKNRLFLASVCHDFQAVVLRRCFTLKRRHMKRARDRIYAHLKPPKNKNAISPSQNAHKIPSPSDPSDPGTPTEQASPGGPQNSSSSSQGSNSRLSAQNHHLPAPLSTQQRKTAVELLEDMEPLFQSYEFAEKAQMLRKHLSPEMVERYEKYILKSVDVSPKILPERGLVALMKENEFNQKMFKGHTHR